MFTHAELLGGTWEQASMTKSENATNFAERLYEQQRLYWLEVALAAIETQRPLGIWTSEHEEEDRACTKFAAAIRAAFEVKP